MIKCNNKQMNYASSMEVSLFTGGVAGDQIGQLAIITRSNFTLFNEASRIACEDNKLKIAFAGVSLLSSCDILFVNIFLHKRCLLPLPMPQIFHLARLILSLRWYFSTPSLSGGGGGELYRPPLLNFAN